MTEREMLIDLYGRIQFVNNMMPKINDDMTDDEEYIIQEIHSITEDLDRYFDHKGIFTDDKFYDWNELDIIYSLYDKIKAEHKPDDIEWFIKAVKPYHDERYSVYDDTIGYYGSDDRTHRENAIDWIEHHYNYIKSHDNRK